MNKPWYKSVTLWVNFLGVPVLDYVTNSGIISGVTGLFILGLVNVIIRAFATNTNLSLTKKSAEIKNHAQ